MRAAASGGLCVRVLALNYKSRYKRRSIHMLVHSFEQKHASFYLCCTRIIPFLHNMLLLTARYLKAVLLKLN